MEGLLALRYKQLLKASSRLDYIIKKFIALSQKATALQEPISDFELCYHLIEKFFTLSLKEHYAINVTSPRTVFQELYKQEILTRDETATLLEMIDAHNTITHIYDESTADAISKKIVDYYSFFDKLIKKINSIQDTYVKH